MSISIFVLRANCMIIFILGLLLLIEMIRMIKGAYKNYSNKNEKKEIVIVGIMAIAFIALSTFVFPLKYEEIMTSDIDVSRVGVEYTVTYHGKILEDIVTENANTEDTRYYLESRYYKNIFGLGKISKLNSKLIVPKEQEILHTNDQIKNK